MKRNALKIGLCLLGAAVLVIAARPLMVTKAGSGSFVTWKESNNDHQVGISLCLQNGDPLEDIVTFQVGFQMEGEEIEDVSFAFDSKLKDNKEIPVKEAIYDEDSQILTIYVSGRETTLKRTDLSLGKLSLNSENDVKISVIEDSCNTVDRFHKLSPITDFGDTEEYTMYSGQTKPTEGTTEETPEETPSETPEEPTPEPSKPSRPSSNHDRDDDDNDNSSYLGIRGNWIMDGTSWIFRKEDGSRAMNEWAMIGGKWYWFDEIGYMKTGWILYNGSWYYCSADGAMKTGWIYDNNTWYYAETSGIMKTGWITVNGSWYYLDQNGKMAADTTTPDGFKVDTNGAWIIN